MNTAIIPESRQGAAPSEPLLRPGHPTIAAIVPAAGRSERMGRPKLLVTIGRQTLIGRVASVLRAGGADRVLVVAPPAHSAEGPAVFAEAQAAGAEVIVPLSRPSEMRASIELALARLTHDRTPQWVILTPGDCPGITPQLVAALIDQAAREPERMIIPVAKGRRGHPIVLPWELAAEIPRLPAGTGVNALVSEHARRLTELTVSSPDVCADLDTPEDLRCWLDRESPGPVSNGEPADSRSLPAGRPEDEAAVSPRRIKLEVQLFAMAKERAGRSTVDIDLPLGARVADLRAAIGHCLPALAPLLSKTMIAVDEEYAADDQVLAPGSRVAVIPPVSGGSPYKASGPFPTVCDTH
jgi:molybdenum cofactor cytidylyltransferase